MTIKSSASAGVRWDVSRDMYLQGTARRQWFDVDGSGYKPLDGLRLEIGFRY